MPRILTAVRDGFVAPPDSQDWEQRGTVGGDGGVLGIYDLVHFHDAGLVPKDQGPVPPTPVPLSQPTLVGNQCWDISTAGVNAATKPGVYCSTGAITLNKNFVGYTWFAKCISISVKAISRQANSK